MKAIKIIFGLTVIGAVLTFSRFLFSNTDRHSQPAEKTARGSIEEVVYMSDIDGLVKAVMLYGVTNGITYSGTNYMFVVEPGQAAARSVLKRSPKLWTEKTYEMPLNQILFINEIAFSDSIGNMKIESSDEDVAKAVNDDRIGPYIMSVGPGSALITVTSAEDEKYISESKSFELVVSEY